MDDGTPFDVFWRAYPRRVGKGDARKAFAKALQQTTLDAILAALRWQCHQSGWQKDGGQFVPHPSTWLNQERWDDEPFDPPPVSERTLRSMKAIYGD